MKVMLIRNADDAHPDADGDKIIDGLDDVADFRKAIKALIEEHGPGTYKIITGRVKVATLTRREVTEFTLE